MIEINLIPKEYLKRSRGFSFGKSGLYAAAGAAAVAVILVSITFFQMRTISSLEAGIEKANRRAAVLNQDIAVVDALTDVKLKITRRMAAVERLDSHRSAYVRILQDLSRNVPEFVWLAKYQEKVADVLKGSAAKVAAASNAKAAPTASQVTANVKGLEIEGYTFTLNALAAFMIKMMRSDYFDEVELVSTLETELFGEKSYKFVLSCQVHFLSDEELRQLASVRNAEKLAAKNKTSHMSLN